MVFYSDDSSEKESNSYDAKSKLSPEKLQKQENSTKAHGIVSNKSPVKKSPSKQLKTEDSEGCNELAKKQVTQNNWKEDYLSSDEDRDDRPSIKNIKVERFSSDDESGPIISQTQNAVEAKKILFNNDDEKLIVSNSKNHSFSLYDDNEIEDVDEKPVKKRKILIKRELVTSEEDEILGDENLDETIGNDLQNDVLGSNCNEAEVASDTEIQPSQFWLNRYKKKKEKDDNDEKIAIRKADLSSPKNNSNSEVDAEESRRKSSPPRITKTEIVNTKYKRTDNKLLNAEEERDSNFDSDEKIDNKEFTASRTSSEDNQSDNNIFTHKSGSQESESNIKKVDSSNDEELETKISPRKKIQSPKKVQASPKKKLSSKSKILDNDSRIQAQKKLNKKSPVKKNLNNKLNKEPFKSRPSICNKDGTSEEEQEEQQKPVEQIKSPRNYVLSLQKLKNRSNKSPNSTLTQTTLVLKKYDNISEKNEVDVSPKKQTTPRKNVISNHTDENSSEDSFTIAAPSSSIKRKLSPKKSKLSVDDSEEEEPSFAQLTTRKEQGNSKQHKSNESASKSVKRKLEPSDDKEEVSTTSDDAEVPLKKKRLNSNTSEIKSTKRTKATPSPKLNNNHTLSDSDDTDSLTKLNTSLNKSIASFTENKIPKVKTVNLSKSRKSVSINIEENVEYSNDSTTQRSILKKPEQSATNDNNEEIQTQDSDVQPSRGPPIIMKRPLNLQSLKDQESLTDDSTKASFGLEDISDDDEIYIIDVPRTIDPKELRGQTIRLGGKNKLHIGDQLYETCGKDPINISCVFRTDKEENSYKAVNVRPAGWINVRQRLSKTLHVELLPFEKRTVPFPENLKTRHPLFGAAYEEKIIVTNNVSKKTSRSVTKSSSIQRLNESSKTKKREVKAEILQKPKNKKLQLSQECESKNDSSDKLEKTPKVKSNNSISSDSDSDESFFQKVKQESICKPEKRKKSTNLLSILNVFNPKDLSANKKLGSSLKNTSFDINQEDHEFFSSTPIKIEKTDENSEDEFSINKIKKKKSRSDIEKVTKSAKKSKAI